MNKFKKTLQLIAEGLLKPMSADDIKADRDSFYKNLVNEKIASSNEALKLIEKAGLKFTPITSQVAVTALNGQYTHILATTKNTALTFVTWMQYLEYVIDMAKKLGFEITYKDDTYTYERTDDTFPEGYFRFFYTDPTKQKRFLIESITTKYTYASLTPTELEKQEKQTLEFFTACKSLIDFFTVELKAKLLDSGSTFNSNNDPNFKVFIRVASDVLDFEIYVKSKESEIFHLSSYEPATVEKLKSDIRAFVSAK